MANEPSRGSNAQAAGAASQAAPPERPAVNRARRDLRAFLVFAVVFFAHFFSDVRTPADSVLTLPRAMSILAHGDTDVEEYRTLPYWGSIGYMIENVNGRLYCMYPIGPSLVALPFVAAADMWWRHARGQIYEEFLKTTPPAGLEEFIASLCVAAASLFVYLAARRQTGREWPALLVVFVLAFGTTAWSVASRALWQHGPSMVFLSLALHLLVVARTRPAAAPFVSLPLAAACVMRPTNSIPLLVFSALVLWRYRRWFLRYVLWALPVAVPFVAFNWNLYGHVLSPYYTPHPLITREVFLTAFLGHVISPARGLLVFSPVLVLGLVGLGIKVREKRLDALDVSLAVILLAHWVAISTMGWQWWGGHSYGPRFFTDVLPFLVWFLVPVARKIGRPMTGGRLALTTAFLILAAAGFAIHYRGANHRAVWMWNIVPKNVVGHTERLWDWSDPPFLRREKR